MQKSWLRSLCFWAIFLASSLALAAPTEARRDSAQLAAETAETYDRLANSLKTLQHPQGHWDGAVDADPSADAIMLLLGERLGYMTPQLREEILTRIFDWQKESGGTLWAGYPFGPPSLDTTGVILYALEKTGIPKTDSRVSQAWDWFNAHGGASKINLASRTILAMAGALPPESVTFVSTKIFALPNRAPFNIHTMGIGRTVAVPLAVWMHYQSACELGIRCPVLEKARVDSKGQLFGKPLNGLPNLTDNLNAVKSVLGTLFSKKSKNPDWNIERALQKSLRIFEHTLPLSSNFWAQEGLGWLLHRQQADGSWGGLLQISTASMLALAEAQRAGVANFDRELRQAWSGLLGWRRQNNAGKPQQQITQGPVMDTARILAAYSTAPESLRRLERDKAKNAITWLLSKQILTDGDWVGAAPDVRPGGWAFQYHNSFYPDVDDTAMVIEAIARTGLASEVPGAIEAMRAGLNWILGLQNKDGGFPVWDRGTSFIFNSIAKIASDGTLGARAPQVVDVSQVDVTSRVLKSLSALRDSGLPEFSDVNQHIDRVAKFLIARRHTIANETLPVWEGDWMTNYLYGTAEVVDALLYSRYWSETDAYPYIQWLLSKQNHASGGWGESNLSYSVHHYVEGTPTLSQSLMVLNAIASYAKSAERVPQDVSQGLEKGIQFVLDQIGRAEFPKENEYTGIYTKDLWYGRYDLLPHYEAVRVLGKYLVLSHLKDCEKLLLDAK